MRANVRQMSWSVALVLALAPACETTGGGGDGGPADVIADTTPTDTTADAGGLDPAWRACQAPSDCAVIEVGCCDHCNGGEVASVNAAYTEQAKAALSPPAGTCPGQCTLLGCAPEVPTCDGGTCGHVPDPAWLAGCEGLGEADCAAAPSCIALTGTPIDTYCAGESAPTFGGCAGNDPPLTCGGALTCGEDPATGTKLVFPSTCLPKGWTACEAVCEEPPSCEGLHAEECAATDGCTPYSGQLIDDPCTPPGIDSPTSFAACGPDPGGCDAVITCGTNPGTGTVMLFPSGCLPPGWEPCDTSGCSSPGCEDLGAEACAADPACMALLGAPYEDVCNDDYSTWMTVFAGCMDQVGCGDAETCARDPETGVQLVFPSTCTPAGWGACDGYPCPVGACAAGTETPIAKMCVRGTPGADGETIAEGAPLQVMVFPKDCWSSSCTTVHEASCAIAGGEPFTVSGGFCLEPTGEGACTPDCSGGGFTTCESEEGLVAGDHAVSLGDLSVTFTVPSVVPFGGICAGSPF